MKVATILLVTVVGLAFLSVPLRAANNDVILLMHGFAGWGPQDGLYSVLPYFGMLHGSMASYLRSKGYTVIETTVGPVSSAWDRVCEAFAEIKGLQTDYGGAHSAKYGHTRQPSARNYAGQGLYPSWGPNNKIHIVAHSMGGQDAHLFASLLNNGNSAEIAHAKANGYTVSPLFAGGNDWIASVSTISSPHDGTSLASYILSNLGFVKDLVVGVATLADVALPVSTLVYNFRLDQWGISPQQSGESLTTYFDRVLADPLWGNTNDLAPYDLSPAGALVLNQNYPLISHIPYFSYATLATYNFFGIQLPDATSVALLWPTETLMGSYTGSSGSVSIGSSWFQNDGVVNTNSMQGPSVGVSGQIVTFSSSKVVYGKFNFVGTWSGYDHLEIVGLNPLLGISSLYLSIAQMVSELPASSSGVTTISLSVSIVPDTAPASANQTCDQMQSGYNATCNSATMNVPDDSCNEIQNNVQQCYAASSSSSSVSTGVIVGAVMGGVAAVVLIAGLLTFFVILPARQKQIIRSASSNSISPLKSGKDSEVNLPIGELAKGDPATVDF